jgi:hypothetical protein
MAFAGNQVINVHQTKNSHIIILAGFGETVTGVTSVKDPTGTYAFSATPGNPGTKLMIRIKCTTGLAAAVKIFDTVSTGDLIVTVTTTSNGTNSTQTIDVPVEFVDDSGA